jgi:hypothetical protein
MNTKTYFDYCVNAGVCPVCLREAVEARFGRSYVETEEEIAIVEKIVDGMEAGDIPFVHDQSWVWLCETHAHDDREEPPLNIYNLEGTL